MMSDAFNGRPESYVREIAERVGEVSGIPGGLVGPPVAIRPSSDMRESDQLLRKSLADSLLEFHSSHFQLVPLGHLGPPKPVDWIWPGYLARRAITILTGIWKGGKTTLITHLMRDLHVGGGLIETPVEGAVLLVSEEPRETWTRRLAEGGLDPERVIFVKRSTYARARADEWRELIRDLAIFARSCEVALVIFDTLPSIWPVENENDASEALEALIPLRELSDAGPAVLAVMHPRKSDGIEGTATRGTGAIPGFADISMELRRVDPYNEHDRRRSLKIYGRFPDGPPETIFELTDAGYVPIGERARIRKEDRQNTILQLLPPDGSGITREEILEAWPHEPKVADSSLRAALKAGVDKKLWAGFKSNRPNRPFEYCRLQPIEENS